MSVTTETALRRGKPLLEKESVYASLFEKSICPGVPPGDINDFLDDAALSDAPAANV
jgi:type VI secretion system protein ImpC